MTDFMKGFNPDNRLNGARFNTTKRDKGQPGEKAPDTTPVDNYADQRLSADEIFSLMNTQAQFNKIASVDHSSIFQSIAAFENVISPETHARMSQSVESVFREEFGFAPSRELVETAVADHLIGRAVIQPGQ